MSNDYDNDGIDCVWCGAEDMDGLCNVCAGQGATDDRPPQTVERFKADLAARDARIAELEAANVALWAYVEALEEASAPQPPEKLQRLRTLHAACERGRP